jgi:predicted DNA-binding protein YlxM (UPF0122 family)
MESQIEKNLVHIHELLAKAQFIEAMETYLHDDVELREANGEAKVGKYAVQGNFSYYDAVMTLKLNDGSTMVSEQVVATEWRDGKIYRERYYHA